MRYKRILFLVWLSLVSLSPIFNLPVHAQADGSEILVLTADGPITPAMAQYLSRGIKIAEREGAEALIFQLEYSGWVNQYNDRDGADRSSLPQFLSLFMSPHQEPWLQALAPLSPWQGTRLNGTKNHDRSCQPGGGQGKIWVQLKKPR